MDHKKKTSIKAGTPPGTLDHVGERHLDETRIRIISYNETELLEKDQVPISACEPFLKNPDVSWISVMGIHDAGHIDAIGKCFRLHPLVMEDIMHSEQRPKFEDFDDYIFIVLKMVFLDEDKTGLKVEQVSLVLGERYVISFQESKRDVFEPLRERIRTGKGRIRRMGADYLAYAVMDSIVDNYFILLEQMGEVVEPLEEAAAAEPRTETLQTIQSIKRQLLSFRRCVWPLREAITGLQRGGEHLISEELFAFLRDLHDHTVQVMDTLETFHMTMSGAMDLYMSSLSNRMNQVAQVLTIVATIFIPLTFIAGVYGMNFKYMPELDLRWAYPACLLLMLLIAALMVLYFKRKKWI